MALDDIIRAGVAIAQTVTAGAQGSITWEAWISQDVYGAPTYASPVTLTGIVDMTRKMRFLDGKMIAIIATITILEPVTPNGAAGRIGPIDVRDRITLPDGTTGPIISGPGAVWDRGAARPFLNEIILGEPA